MSNVNSSNPHVKSTYVADMLANSESLQEAAAVAFQSFGKSTTTVAPSDTPQVQTQITISTPSLSQPTMSASSMMIALMGLQSKASDESVSIGLEGCEESQTKITEQNEARANDMLGYYDTMRLQEDVNGGMSVANVVIAAIFLVAAIAMTVLTAGASTALLVAGVAGCICAASSLASSVISLPSVQESLSENGAKVANIVLTCITLASGIVGAACGFGAIKAGATAAKSAGKASSVITNVAKGVTGATGVASGTMEGTSSVINYQASMASLKIDEHNTVLDELQMEFDTGISDLDAIMQSYSSMVESTANMLQTTYQGARSAATITA